MTAPAQGSNQARLSNYKFTSNMRNPLTQAVTAVPNQTTVQAALTKGNTLNPIIVHIQYSNRLSVHEPLTITMLTTAKPADQKQMIGERLFPFIEKMCPQLAGKVTGMLLEIDNSELLHMLDHAESLKTKVDEALAVLQLHQATNTVPVNKLE